MCDYSAAGIKTRKAVRGEKLVTTNISSHTIGLAEKRGTPVADLAVCLMPGTTVLVAVSANVKTNLGLPSQLCPATFIQRDLMPGKVGFRDAFLFGNGTDVLINELGVGHEVTIETVPYGDQEIRGTVNVYHDAMPAVFRARTDRHDGQSSARALEYVNR